MPEQVGAQGIRLYNLALMPTRRSRISLATLVAVLVGASFLRLAPGLAAPRDDGERFDIVIANGRVMDPESSLDAVRNVGISGRTIRAISADRLEGRVTIDAAGLVVAPGFIDLHEHGQAAENYRFQAFDGSQRARRATDRPDGAAGSDR